MDRIRIEDLTVFANHGVLPEETSLGQKFLITMDLFLNVHKASVSGDLDQTVNYAKVCEEVTAFMQRENVPLIETVAEKLAEFLLMEYPVLHRVLVTVKKPWAPIHLPLNTVSVRVDRLWHKVYLGIGSNMGNKEENLKKAVCLLEEDRKCRVVKTSAFITTKPVGGVEQDDFLNGALQVDTLYTPLELLERIGQIEKELKRERVIHWGPRTIDLDILLYDQEIIRLPQLLVPHIEMHKREFVLLPLSEIAPEAFHPVLQKTVYQLLGEIGGKTR